MAKGKEKEEIANRAREEFKKRFPRVDTVWCVLRSVARDGCSRKIDFYVIIDNEPNWINPFIDKTTGYRFTRSRGQEITVSGGGMDMGFAVVSDFAHAIYGSEKKLQHRWL